MSVYAIAQGRIENRQLFDEYVAAAVPTLEAHGVKLVAMDESAVIVEGNTEYPRTVILQFASEAAFYRWYESPEYQAARMIREKAAKGTFILLR